MDKEGKDHLDVS